MSSLGVAHTFCNPGSLGNTANYLHGWSTSPREDDKLKVHIALAAPMNRKYIVENVGSAQP